MKIKLSELKPNPNKKKINDGKLNEEQVERLMLNMDKLKLMGAIPIVKIGKNFHIVSGHHRVEALKRKFGEDYEIEVILHDYNDEELFRGMVIENLSQRKGEFLEEKSNAVAMREWLTEHVDVLNDLRSVSRRKSTNPEYVGKGNPHKEVSANDISEWLDKSSGRVMSKSKINDLLNINDNLSPDLQEAIVKGATNRVGDGSDDKEDKEDHVFNVENATLIASISKDHEEQKEVLEALRNSKGDRMHRVRTRQKVISAYKEAEEDEKKLIRKGKKDIALVGVETPKEVNDALKKEEIDIDQARRISNLKKPEQVKKAIQEHKNINLVDKHVEKSVEDITSAKEKREFDKRLVQAGNWIVSFRGSVTDSYRSLEKTIKILMISTNFISIMDKKQKEALDSQLSRFNEILERAKQLTEKIEEKTKGGDE